MNTNSRQLRVSHIITGLDAHGAEMVLYRLLANTDKTAFQSRVLSLTGNGVVGDKIRQLGVPVTALSLGSPFTAPFKMLRLINWIRRGSPDVVQTWMYTSDMIGGIASKIAGNIPVIWGIHHSNFAASDRGGAAYWSAQVCRRIGWLPNTIVCCSEASQVVHRQIGYPVNKMVLITNGIDTQMFKPDTESGISVRKSIGVPLDAVLIGLVARYHPQKDHRTFVSAAAHLLEKHPDVHFALCGDDITSQNAALSQWINEIGAADRFHLLGPRSDIPKLMAGFDIATSSAAHGEAFPNVLVEAMACGVPCVATNVGDSANIIGDTGKIVAPQDPVALANAWCEMVEGGEELRKRLAIAARDRIREHYDLPTMVSRYESLYRDVASASKKGSS